MSKDPRHPYTHSCDLIRSFAGYGPNGAILSRSDASSIRAGIAAVIGMKDEELAAKLADHFLANEDEIAKRGAERFIAAMNWK